MCLLYLFNICCKVSN